jgi:hypothetical protein
MQAVPTGRGVIGSVTLRTQQKSTEYPQYTRLYPFSGVEEFQSKCINYGAAGA